MINDTSRLGMLTASLIDKYTQHLDVQQKRELMEAVDKLAQLKRGRLFYDMFPDEGPLRRELYAAHMRFIRAGADFREKLFMAGNRTGKSIVGCYEAVAHATGQYPEWWEGRRWTRPVKMWIGGDTSQTLRDIIQQKLLGNPGEEGTGMIPKDCIVKLTPKRGLPDAIETIQVKHISGGVSTITFKSYEQGRETWQGTEQDIIWMDEEPPMDVYAEALMRTMTTNGMVMSTFTPLKGISEVIKGFMAAQIKPTEAGEDWKPLKYMTQASWDDAPHLDERAKSEMLSTIPPNQRDARSKGLPTIGSGLIYPCDDSVYVKDFEVPKYWAKVYGMDVGWNVTGAVFGALDRDNDILYITSEYYGQQQEPVVHADAIKRRGGTWMKGVIDTASRGRSQIDGANLWDIYSRQHKLRIYPANKAVESGIYEVWTRLSSGRLKIFKSCQNLEREMKMYHRDEKGRINKSDDHLLDALRYLVMSGIPLATTAQEIGRERSVKPSVSLNAWV